MRAIHAWAYSGVVGRKMRGTLEMSKAGPGKETPAITGGEKGNPASASNTPGSPPDLTTESPGPASSEDHASPEGTTLEQEASQDSQKRLAELLGAYQETLDAVGNLPAVVWVPWDRKRPGSYIKVPYLRWFLTYFVTHHINRSLDALNRRYHAAAALAGDPDSNQKTRESVKLFLGSLPSPPYRVLLLTAILSALVIALPLQGFGNVFYLLDLVAALLRFDVGYVGQALDGGNHIGPTVRSVIVLLIGLAVVGAVLTSPFGLKRMLFNLYPWSNEPLGSTAARSHVYRVEGIYDLEDRIFEEAGIRRPRERHWDLMFQIFMLLLLLVIGLCLALLTLIIFMAWNITLDVDTGAEGNFQFYLPEVSWIYYALITTLIFTAFILLLRRLVAAWKNRSRHARG
jgi:hypothetical protein